MRVRCDSKNADGQNGFSDMAGLGLDTSSQDSFSAGFPTLISAKNLHSVAVSVTQDQSKEEAVHGTPARTFERRRTTSSSRREDSFEEDHVDVIPFILRVFPLPDDEVKQMLAAAKELEEEDTPIVHKEEKEAILIQVKELVALEKVKDQQHLTTSIPTTTSVLVSAASVPTSVPTPTPTPTSASVPENPNPKLEKTTNLEPDTIPEPDLKAEPEKMTLIALPPLM